ncbi:hypothetical protein Syun_030066 [Stephania yunnanensis]|uniref:Cupin type-1 domain-containing protein n=1 Tax=Stephania yunnanensis TaxID=152371 RepID=A0AAP0HK54_9MAGN
MSKLPLLLLFSFLCLCSAQSGRQTQQWQQPNRCQIHRIQARQPQQRFESEGGVTEIWFQNNDEFRCAGVVLIRQTIKPNSFDLPGYNNAPKLAYVVQGNLLLHSHSSSINKTSTYKPLLWQGLHSLIVPGCAETYQSVQQYSQQETQRRGGQVQDEHQKVRRIREGDVVANPTGMVHWYYNDGNTDLVLVSILDTSSNMNQLDQQYRKFYLAGDYSRLQRLQEQRQEEQPERYQEQGISANNIFGGIDDQILQEVLGVERDLVEKIKGRGDMRGHMIRAKSGFQLIRPSRMEEEYERQSRDVVQNGLEETLCTMRLRENIGKPSRADVYNPQAGRISTVTNNDLPILRLLGLSATRGVLHRNAIYAPHWNLNAHSLIYVTRGSARVQIVGNQQQNAIFDGQVQEGQVLVVPQNYVVVKQAGDRGFEWVSFKTHENAMTHNLVGKTSPFRGLPVDMLASMYQISRQEAENLKYNRGQEVALFVPSHQSQGRASA